jgi:2-keto-4-pentenoate hydratase/2-oxohepta-3-ene-1,7-dioic acid hydratase in catechol pathway
LKLVTISLDGEPTPGVLLKDGIHRIVGHKDVISVLQTGREPEYESAALISEADAEFLPPIPTPGKIICVGLNYDEHRVEAERPSVAYPTIFTRWPDTQVGHRKPLKRPAASEQYDYEGELALAIGMPGRSITKDKALQHVAGYACYNEGSVRDWQKHTSQFTPGKNFPESASFGPALCIGKIADPSTLTLTTRLNGEIVQQAGTDLMIFSVPELIEYISAFTPLNTGDIIVTGTPAGVGSRRRPPLFMKDGDVVEVEITGLGTLVNPVVDGI